MKYHKLSNIVQSCWIITLLLSCSILCHAKPTVTRPSLRLGFSIRMPRFSWATFSCHIQNPDKKAHKILLRVTTAEGLTQYNVFQDSVTVPPETVVEYKTDFLIETAEKYDLEVFCDGKKLTGPIQDMLLKMMRPQDITIGIINDSYDLSLGAFNQLPVFKGKYYSSQFQSSQIPENWKTLQKFTALVMIEPDFSKINSRQYQSILQYVSMGGIIIFANPNVLFDVIDSPLASLAPVVPIKLRKVENLPLLKRISSTFKGWNEKVDFLEAIPKKDSVTLLKTGEFPLITWKKYGLGSCRFSAVPLCGQIYEKDNKQTWEDLLIYFFNHQRLFPNPDEFVATLDEMTGFPVPTIGLIRNLFIAYFSILAVLMIIGYFTRHSGIIWGVSGLYAIIATLYVLHLSRAQSNYQGQLFACVEINAYSSGTPVPVEGYYGIYSDSNIVISFDAKDENSLFCAIPPPASSSFGYQFAGPGKGRAQGNKKNNNLNIREAFDIRRNDGVAQLAEINLRALLTKQFNGGTTIYNEYANQLDPPVIEYDRKGINLIPWNIPKGLKPEYVFIQYPSGIIQLEYDSKNNQARIPKEDNSSFIHSNKILRSLQKSLLEGYKHTAPAIVVVEKLTKPQLPMDDPNTNVQGKRISMFPAREVCKEKGIKILQEQIVMTSGDGSSRTIMPGNKLESSNLNTGSATYLFDFKLPPIFSQIQPSKITIDFSYLNQGGNIAAQPYLLIHGNGKLEKRKIKGIQEKTGVFVFKGKDLKSVFNPLDGTGKILIEGSEKKKTMNQAQKLSANKWDITKLEVSVDGSLPQQLIPLEY